MLIVLFAFCLTSLLVVQQQRTIESQRTLIQALFNDSLALSQIRVNAIATRARH
jgi:hypothetical protein